MDIICFLVQALVFAIFGRIILSWFFPFADGSPMATVYSFVFAVTEPILGPVRRVMPAVRTGAVALDLSPIIVLLVLELVVRRFVC